MNNFTRRSYQKEMMDDLVFEGAELKQTLKELKTINKFLGGNYVTTNGMKQLLLSKKPGRIKVADIGCGGGDMLRVMANWAKKRKIAAEFTGIDANPNIIDLAKENLKDLPQVKFETANVFDRGFINQQVDIITCTLFTHHFTDEELVEILGNFKEKAKIGIVINDLHRHPLAYHSIRLLTRWFSTSEMVRNDGPLSVCRSFKKMELESLLYKAGFHSYKISWHWAFRWQIICMCQ